MLALCHQMNGYMCKPAQPEPEGTGKLHDEVAQMSRSSATLPSLSQPALMAS